MGQDSFVTLNLAGILLIVSVLAPLLGLVLIGRGDFGGFQASIRGIEGVGEKADILRRSFPISALTVLLTLGGFGALTLLLAEGGAPGLAPLAFALLLFSQVFMVLQGSFHGSVTVWAAKQLADTGAVPELFEPLWRWMYSAVQQVYVNVNLLALAIYGLAILQSALLPAWLGWGAIGWSAAWLAFFLAVQDNLPLVLFIPPLVIGILALLA